MSQQQQQQVDALLAELRGLKARLGEIEGELLSIGEQQHRGGGAAPASSAPSALPAAAAALLNPFATPQQRPPSPAPPPPDVPIASTRVVSCHIVRPADCDAQGVCVGGNVLSWIDICAGLSAKTLARGPCVTVSVDAVHFLRPCTLGCVVIVAARVNRTFASSMEVGVRVEAEDPRTGERAHCCSAYLTFVSMRARCGGGGGGGARGASARTSGGGGGGGLIAAAAPQVVGTGGGGGGTATTATTTVALAPRPPAPPAPLPTVVPTTGETRREWQQAAERRAARLAARRRLGADPAFAAAAAECRLRPVTHREGFPTLPPVLTAPCSLVEHFASGAGGSSTGGGGGASGSGGGGGGAGLSSSSLGGGGSGEQGAAAAAGGETSRSANNNSNANGYSDGDHDRPSDDNDDDDDDGIVPPEVDVLAQQLRGSAIASARTRLLSPRSPAAAAAAAPLRSPLAPLQQRIRVSPASTTAYATHSILPQYANTLGVTFGGQVMAWIEQCAYVSAARLRGARRADRPPARGNDGDGAGAGSSAGGGAGSTFSAAAPSQGPSSSSSSSSALRFLTAGMDSVAFVQSTVVGDVMYLTAQCSAAFGASLEVAVSVFAESPREGRVFHCADAYVTVVVVDGRGRPVPIPFELAPDTAAERMRYEGAVGRREERLALRRALVAKSRASLEVTLDSSAGVGAAAAHR